MEGSYFIGNRKVEKKLDGIFLIGEDLSFLSPSTSVFMSLPGLIETKKPNWVKGNKTFGTADVIWTWRVAQIQNLSVYLCFYTPAGRRVDFHKLLRTIYDAIRSAIFNLPSDSRTRRSFTGNISGGASRRSTCAIYMEDFETFSLEFGKELRSICETVEIWTSGQYSLVEPYPLSSCVVAEATGQSCMISDSRIIHFCENIRLSQLCEVIFHIAFDITVEEHVILFNREQLVKLFGRPYLEYYAGCLGSHGNFYFNGNDNHIRIIKCYTSIFSDVHRSMNPPFKVPVMSNQLFRLATGDILSYHGGVEVAFDEHLTTVRNLRNLVDEMEHIRAFSGRIELIAGFESESVNLNELSFMNVIEECDNFVNDKGLLDGDAIVSIPILNFLSYVRKYIVSATCCLTNNLEACKQRFESNTPIVYTLREHFDVVAAEAIICTMIYGSALSVNTRSHSNDLCRMLGITLTQLKSATMFGEIKNVTIEPSGLHFYPLHYVQYVIPQGYSEEGLNFSEVIRRIWEKKDEPNSRKTVIGFLINRIRETALHVLGMAKTGTMRDTEAASRRYQNRRMLSVEGFIDWLIAEGSTSKAHQGFFNIMKMIVQFIPSEEQLDFRLNLIKEMELIMVRRREHLVFAKHANETKVVVPLGSMEGMLQIEEYLQRSFQSRFNIYGGNAEINKQIWKNVLIVVAENPRMKRNSSDLDELYNNIRKKFFK